MNLLLAYSASHRARLLHHPEPANRIAVYVKDVFPKLRHAVTTNEPVSISTLATAIMLASLEILSPGAFGFGIPWQTHLSIARQMVIARGGPTPIAAAQRGTRRVYFAGKPVKTPTYARDALRAGNRIEGPALIEEHASTTVVLPGDRLRVDEFGNLMLDIAGRRR